MRVTIKFDSATTEQVRKLAVALRAVNLGGELRVGLCGPEKWSGETPPLHPNQWARIACELITLSGATSIAQFVKDHAGIGTPIDWEVTP